MWIDGIELERKEDFNECFMVNEKYLLITNKDNDVVFTFNLEYNNENVNEDIKSMAIKHILHYDIIKDMQ